MGGVPRTPSLIRASQPRPAHTPSHTETLRRGRCAPGGRASPVPPRSALICPVPPQSALVRPDAEMAGLAGRAGLLPSATPEPPRVVAGRPCGRSPLHHVTCLEPSRADSAVTPRSGMRRSSQSRVGKSDELSLRRVAVDQRLPVSVGWGHGVCRGRGLAESDGMPSAAGTQTEPSRAEPSRVESSRAEPIRAESSRAEPSRAEWSGAGSSRVEPSRVESSRAEPSRAEPSRAGSSQAEPGLTKPIRAGPSQAEPGLAKPSLAVPSQAEPSCRDAGPTEVYGCSTGFRRSRASVAHFSVWLHQFSLKSVVLVYVLL